MARRKRAFNRMPDAELLVMQGIWDEEAKGAVTVRASELIDANPDTIGQQKLTTVLTLLTRLTERGYVKVEKMGRSNLYSSAISEADYRKLATQDFVRNVCRQSTGSLLSALVAGGLIENEDIDELRTMVNQEEE
ncbi:MAG: BlaI/MecI/CopY family transcriptional regulator [Clostridia bacterium]|nr:BlaI/MecI/CopY family transcriptional regulator [Clostridia bacterium]